MSFFHVLVPSPRGVTNAFLGQGSPSLQDGARSGRASDIATSSRRSPSPVNPNLAILQLLQEEGARRTELVDCEADLAAKLRLAYRRASVRVSDPYHGSSGSDEEASGSRSARQRNSRLRSLSAGKTERAETAGRRAIWREEALALHQMLLHLTDETGIQSPLTADLLSQGFPGSICVEPPSMAQSFLVSPPGNSRSQENLESAGRVLEVPTSSRRPPSPINPALAALQLLQQEEARRTELV
eukprot:RCo050760